MYSWEIFSNYVDHVSIVDKDASASDQRPRPSDVVRVRRSCTMAPSNNTSYAISEAASDDLHDYDVISDTGPGSLDSSIADLAGPPAPPKEIPPSAAARNAYDTTILSPEDIQTNVQRALRGGSRNGARSKSREPVSERETERTIRLYVDGVFDFVHAGYLSRLESAFLNSYIQCRTALQLRQARLSFPAVQLLVGPFTDESCRQYSVHAAIPHTERCELMRHIRWFDEVIFDAPVVLNEDFIRRNRIDFVAIEEGSSVDPLIGKERLRGYDLVKSLGENDLPTVLIHVAHNIDQESPS